MWVDLVKFRIEGLHLLLHRFTLRFHTHRLRLQGLDPRLRRHLCLASRCPLALEPDDEVVMVVVVVVVCGVWCRRW